MKTITILTLFSLLLVACSWTKAYNVKNSEGQDSVLILYSDSTFKYQVKKDSFELTYLGNWTGGLLAGDTLFTTATKVNNDLLSNRHTWIYYFERKEPIPIDYKMH